GRLAGQPCQPFPGNGYVGCAPDPATSPQRRVGRSGWGFAPRPGAVSTRRGARGALVMCGMIESNHPAQEGAHMLRKKKSLLDRAVDSASDAVDAARAVIEAAVTQARDLSQTAT